MVEIFNSVGQSIPIDDANSLGAGGEAKGIYRLLEDPPRVVKIFSKQTPVSKLEYMIANPPDDPMVRHKHVSFTWPQELAYDHNKSVVGYVMPCAPGKPLISAYSFKLRKLSFPHFSFKHLHRIALNLAKAIRSVHWQSYVIGDLKPQNIHVGDEAFVTIIDVDSFQVPSPHGTLRCAVGTPEYTPIEVTKQAQRFISKPNPFKCFDLEESNDDFILAIIIFQLLTGRHPYAHTCKGRLDPDKFIRLGHFPYHAKARRKPPRRALPFDIIQPELRALFIRCFVDGHKDPLVRPTTTDWVDALKQAEDELQTCSQNTQHIYGEHLRACPWCEHKRETKVLDLFPPKPNASTLQQPQPRPTPAPHATHNTQSSQRVAGAQIPPAPHPAPNKIYKPQPRVISPKRTLEPHVVAVGGGVLFLCSLAVWAFTSQSPRTPQPKSVSPSSKTRNQLKLPPRQQTPPGTIAIIYQKWADARDPGDPPLEIDSTLQELASTYVQSSDEGRGGYSKSQLSNIIRRELQKRGQGSRNFIIHTQPTVDTPHNTQFPREVYRPELRTVGFGVYTYNTFGRTWFGTLAILAEGVEKPKTVRRKSTKPTRPKVKKKKTKTSRQATESAKRAAEPTNIRITKTLKREKVKKSKERARKFGKVSSSPPTKTSSPQKSPSNDIQKAKKRARQFGRKK